MLKSNGSVAIMSFDLFDAIYWTFGYKTIRWNNGKCKITGPKQLITIINLTKSICMLASSVQLMIVILINRISFKKFCIRFLMTCLHLMFIWCWSINANSYAKKIPRVYRNMMKVDEILSSNISWINKKGKRYFYVYFVINFIGQLIECFYYKTTFYKILAMYDKIALDLIVCLYVYEIYNSIARFKSINDKLMNKGTSESISFERAQVFICGSFASKSKAKECNTSLICDCFMMLMDNMEIISDIFSHFVSS